MNKKKADGGFTLIEVIIAVTILTIIVTPLLRMFTSAARTNAKARKVMQATTVAQNLTEDIKAYTLRNLSRRVNNYTVDENGNSFSLRITDADKFEAKCTEDTDGKITSVTPVIKSENAGAYGASDSSMSAEYRMAGAQADVTSSEFVGNADNRYYFVFQNVSCENSRAKYDAVVKLESTYTTRAADISSMNDACSAYYAESDGQSLEVAAEFAGRVPGGTVSASDIESRLVRTVTVTISSDGGDETVTLGTEYTCSSVCVTGDNTYSIPSKVIYNNFISHQNLESVYIFYYPIYSTDVRDTFRVINTTGEDITVSFISMARSSVSYTSAQTANYRVRLSVSEDAAGISENSSHTRICSNVDASKWTASAVINGLGNIEQIPFKYDATVWVYEHEDTFTRDSDKYILKLTASKLDME